jgi:hypothetical protein
MEPLRGDDSDELGRYKAVLEQCGRFGGLVKWKQQAAETLREHLSNHTQRSIEILLHAHRNEVDQTEESRPEYRDRYRYHYDFRIPIDGQRVYIETVFEPGATEDDASIRVVRIKPVNPGEPWGTRTP